MFLLPGIVDLSQHFNQYNFVENIIIVTIQITKKLGITQYQFNSIIINKLMTETRETKLDVQIDTQVKAHMLIKMQVSQIVGLIFVVEINQNQPV